jgi:Predicted Fe-S-cluster oxidoreductase
MDIKNVIDRINASTEKKNAYNLLLNQVYAEIPSGSCVGCAKCCSESVNVSLVELANIFENGISKLLPKQREELYKRIISFYLSEWVKPNACPFLDNEKRCTIYEVRPLPCRIFGAPSEDAYESNYMKIRKQNLTFAKSLYTFEGIKLSPKVLMKKIDFCENFIPEYRLESDSVEGLYSQLINLDGKLYFDGIIDEPIINGDLVSWVLDYIIDDANEINNSLTNASIVSKEMLYQLKLDYSKHHSVK